VASTPPVPSAADILALLEAFRVAYERKDLRALMGLFGAQPVEGETAGRPAVERLYTRNFAVLDGIRYELTDVEIGPAGDGQFVARGRFRIRAARPGDSTPTFDARGGVRWRVHRESGDLRIAGIDYVVDP
jgi:hypothetical protein